MARLRNLANSVNAASHSRIAWLFASLHAAWFFLAIANMSPPSRALGAFFDRGGGSTAALLAGRPFHFEYESIFLKLLFLMDLPSIVAAFPLSVVSAPLVVLFRVGHYYGSYV